MQGQSLSPPHQNMRNPPQLHLMNLYLYYLCLYYLYLYQLMILPQSPAHLLFLRLPAQYLPVLLHLPDLSDHPSPPLTVHLHFQAPAESPPQVLSTQRHHFQRKLHQTRSAQPHQTALFLHETGNTDILFHSCHNIPALRYRDPDCSAHKTLPVPPQPPAAPLASLS